MWNKGPQSKSVEQSHSTGVGIADQKGKRRGKKNQSILSSCSVLSIVANTFLSEETVGQIAQGPQL